MTRQTALRGDPAIAESGRQLRSVSSTERMPVLEPDAVQGLAGEILRTVSPHTEADPAAILVSLLAMFGNAVGPGPHVEIDHSTHGATLYVCVVGDTNSGRKGTSAAISRRLVTAADQTWPDCIKDGLVSGEGVIHHVRDGTVAADEDSTSEIPQGVSRGVRDKRLFVLAAEFAQVLATIRRPDNSLSPVLRSLWDCGDAHTLAKRSPERTTGAHVTILAHITPTELRRKLDSTETANGFANRFLFIASERSKYLPRGNSMPDADRARLGEQLRQSILASRNVGEVLMTKPAWDLWDAEYRHLSSSPPGLLGEVTARGPANVRRLAMLYALLDGQGTVDVQHLSAALAVWRYSAASARWIFGDRLGHQLADKLRSLLRGAGAGGATRAEIRDSLGHRVTGIEIEDALQFLASHELAHYVVEPSRGGRPPERWYIGPPPLAKESRVPQRMCEEDRGRSLDSMADSL